MNKDKTINGIISEFSKLALKEYKTRHDRVEKEIHWELCKILKFDRTNKWYMHNSEFVLWDFEILTYHLISTRPPDLAIVNNNSNKNKKENLPNIRLCLPGRSQSQTKTKMKVEISTET